jgi:copper(I)-binding protein
VAVIRTSRRTAGRSRAAAAALVAAGVTVLAGCQAGQYAQTSEQIPTIDGTFAQVGSLALRNVTIEYPETGSWPQGSDARLQLVIVNEGRDADTLVEVRTDAAERVTLATEPAASPTASAPAATTAAPTSSAAATPSGTPTGSASGSPSESGSATASSSATASATPEPTPTEAAETTIPIPGPGLVALRDGGPEILLSGLTRTLRPAQVVPVTFVFAQAGEVTVNVAVAVPTEEVSPAPTVPVGSEAGE